MVRLSAKRLLCRLLLIALAILAAYLLYVSEKAMGKQCSREGSMEILHKLCALYVARKVDGNLCHKICNPDTLRYERCFNRVSGKKVIQVQLDGRRAVLKSRHAEVSEYDPVFEGALGEDDKTSSAARFMSQNSFITLVLNHIESKFGTEISLMSRDEVISRLLLRAGNTLEELSTVQMNSLWSLVQQDEFVFFTVFKDTSYFPEVYGACGHFYAEEFFPPGAVLYPSTSEGAMERYHAAAWQPRAKAAKGILDIVRATETEFKEPLHLCDVKAVNFGIVNGKVKAIDIDISFFDNVMGNFLEQPNCSKHEDCDFFDCHGICNMETKKCTRKRQNNNFQAVCKDIFGMKLGSPGLLRHPPPRISEQVSQLIGQCTNPGESARVAKGSTTDTFHRLYSLLAESLRDAASYY